MLKTVYVSFLVLKSTNFIMAQISEMMFVHF